MAADVGCVLDLTNPFRFEGPVPPAALIARETEHAVLVEPALDHRVVSVAAPRRYGKTSLLRAAGQTLQNQHGFVVAHVDLEQLAGVEDFVARFGQRGGRRPRTYGGGAASSRRWPEA